MSNDVKQNILTLVKNCQTVQLSTFGLSNYPETRIIANMLNIDKTDFNDAKLYFMTNINSNKIEQIKKNFNVCIYYCNLDTRHSMTLFGNIKIITDLKEKSKFWNDSWKNFGYTSEEDENYCVLEFTINLYKYYLSGQKISGKF